MKNRIVNGVFIGVSLFLLVFVSSCKKDDDKPKAWVVSYANISIGDQESYNMGHFFKPQTGEVIAVEDTANEEEFLAMLIFTENGGSNLFWTFPADGEAASTFGTSGIRLFTQNPGGIDLWEQGNLVSGMLYKTAMTTAEYDNLVGLNSWDNFDDIFKENNQANANLSFKLGYELNPESGNVYLIQFDGLVRAIIAIKNVVPSSANGGSIKFDITIEGHESYENNTNAINIMPAKPS